MTVAVEVVRQASDELVDALAGLLPQLSTSAAPLDFAAIDRLARSEATTLLVARVEGEIVGTLSLVLFSVPAGLRARVEDVVVDSAARGHGVAAALTGEALR
ncbi:GNAT family N-acetyltransferase, partial [Streptomyces sp. T-3]|nr:GNAT family N-acetyltransferase [Streptomyces sp. T-3]